jgi:hypothetical protein
MPASSDEEFRRVSDCGRYYGIFAVENGVLRALAAKRGFAPELRGAVAEDAGEKLGRLLK